MSSGPSLLGRVSHPFVSDTRSASSERPSSVETLAQADAFPDLPTDPDLPLSVPSLKDNTTTTTTPITTTTVTFPSTTVPSNSARNIRSQSLAHTHPPTIGNPPIRRKPLSSSASPLVIKSSPRDQLQISHLPAGPEQRFSRSCSVDSPTLYDFSSLQNTTSRPLSPLVSPISPQLSQPSSPVGSDSTRLEYRAAAPAGESLARNSSATIPAAAQTPAPWSPHESLISVLSDPPTQEPETSRDRVTSLGPSSGAPPPVNDNINTTMSLAVRKTGPPPLSLEQIDSSPRPSLLTVSPVVDKNRSANINKPLPKSPASSKFGSFFGWATSPSSTEFSDKAYSPLPSPFSPRPKTGYSEADDTSTSGRHTLRSATANAADESPLDYCEGYLQTPPGTANSSAEIEEMEDELKAISAELAASIRREMDLEDLVDRLQEQVNTAQAPGKRTSDYFSDSGYSSAKFSDYEQAREEISQIQRRAEQEKAQIRLELTEKLQGERSRRKVLDQQISDLSKRAQQIDLREIDGKDATGRVKELEATCDDLRRRLSEERRVKENFEDLLSALRGELENATNERDNLRDEIVPQLRARVEGLEAQAAESVKLAYDTTKMQQEIQSLRDENQGLKKSGPREAAGLTRSASIAGSSYKMSRPPSLARSNTVKQAESREALAERLKDVEAQRDALHSALKSLLDRQEFQNRENQKRIRALEAERDRLLAASPEKAGYEKEVANLRREISVLRRRAEEAIEQKWQVEKGLSGLKMDLDRAEAEIASLRQLLTEKDILIPETLARSSRLSDQSSSSAGSAAAAPVSSASLEKAYKELQSAYAEALERIKNLEAATSGDEKTMLAMQRLEQSLSAAVSERDLARHEADSYRSRLDAYQSSEKDHLAHETSLASQLQDSARRVEELAEQVRAQLATNATLRERLNEAVARGEADQRASKERVAGIQARLRVLEEQLVAAQMVSEERVGRHEAEIAALKEAHNQQLRRLRDAPPPTMAARRTATSPLPLSLRASSSSTRGGAAQRLSPQTLLLSPSSSPRPALRRISTAPSDSGEAAEIETLRTRVRELEGALASADAEMQEVVARMSAAQIEVLTLQEAREEAVRETRRLQRQLEEEKMAAFEKRFKTITG